MTTAQLAQETSEAEDRQKIYALLASVFLQNPTAERLARQRASLGAMIDGGLNRDALLSDVETVEQSYFDCFFVPTSGCYVPPYESALRPYSKDKKTFGQLNGASTAHILKCWRETGFDPDTLSLYEPLEQNCLPDHIGLELAFMMFLCAAEHSALLSGAADRAAAWRTYQAGFLADHLRIAGMRFAEALQDRASGYYVQAAAAAAAWIEADFTALDQKKG